MRGYYSEKQREVLAMPRFNSLTKETYAQPMNVYATPDGREVTVTCVGDNPPVWDDAIDLGEVSHWLRFVPA